MTQPNPELQLIPDTYSPDWIERLDGRTRVAQAVKERLAALVTDCGGDLSYQRYSLCKRAVWMEAVIERQEAALARGEDIDQGRWTQAVNTLVGVLRTLGLERRAKPTEDLQSYMRRRAAESAGGQSAA